MAAESYSFETTCVDVVRMVVTRDGVPVSLEPKAMDVLLYLLANRDRLVTKDELLDAVWKDTFVTPNTLTRSVALLRKALGDDAQEPRIIGTVAKRGYRFIAPVTEAASGFGTVPPTATAAAQTAAATGGRMWPVRATVGAVTGLLAIVVAAVWFINRPAPAPAPAAAGEIAVTRFTTRLGVDSFPSISPDGRSVVYVSDRTGSLELYQTGLTVGAPDVALTSNGGRNTQPEWSPDGKWVAFRSERFGGIWVVPSAGGPPQQIVDAGSDPSWSPDSERLAFVSDVVSSATPSALWTVRRDGGDRQAVPLSISIVGVVIQPAWSHNGRFIAFAVNQGRTLRDVWVTSTDGRVVRKVATGLTGQDIRWAPDDDGLFWGGVNEQRLSRLMHLRMNPETGEAIGTPEGRLPIDAGRMEGLSLARDGRALFGIVQSDANLWQIDLRGNDVGEATRLTADTVRTTYPRISRDGRIAFVQFVDGREVTAWIMAADGTDRVPLMSSGAIQAPHWSRDASRMFALLDGRAVWVDLATRRTTPIEVQFDSTGSAQLVPDESGLLNHRAGAGGVINVWLSPFGGGPPRQMTFDPEGASYGAYAPDGRWIGVQLTRGSDTWLGVMPAEPGAAIVPLVKERGQSWLYSWSPDSERLAFAGERDGVWNIYDVERATGTVRQLTHWTDLEGYVRYPAWAPDGSRIVFERATRSASIWSAKLW
jgi:Tol biopolymer transport system component/DNA-binding winged helix-turn-helix (wHTH) protein